MSNVFIIGDRLKSEWVSALDTENKRLEFSSLITCAKEFDSEEYARQQLAKLRETGYFSDLQVYMKEDGMAVKPDEHVFLQ